MAIRLGMMVLAELRTVARSRPVVVPHGSFRTAPGGELSGCRRSNPVGPIAVHIGVSSFERSAIASSDELNEDQGALKPGAPVLPKTARGRRFIENPAAFAPRESTAARQNLSDNGPETQELAH